MGQVVKIESKELLNSMSNKFGEYVTQLTGEIDSLKTTLSSVENYEDINYWRKWIFRNKNCKRTY